MNILATIWCHLFVKKWVPVWIKFKVLVQSIKRLIRQKKQILFTNYWQQLKDCSRGIAEESQQKKALFGKDFLLENMTFLSSWLKLYFESFLTEFFFENWDSLVHFSVIFVVTAIQWTLKYSLWLSLNEHKLSDWMYYSIEWTKGKKKKKRASLINANTESVVVRSYKQI